MKERMKIHDHICFATDIKIAQKIIREGVVYLSKHLPHKNKAFRQIEKLNNDIITLKHYLDIEYHAIISDKEYEKYGNVYYGELHDTP